MTGPTRLYRRLEWHVEVAYWSATRPFWLAVSAVRWAIRPKALVRCEDCGAVATWHLMPAGCAGEYCDACVPRGCDCNNVDGYGADEPVYTSDIRGEAFNHVEPAQHRDELGRLLPCIEYTYYRFGWLRRQAD